MSSISQDNLFCFDSSAFIRLHRFYGPNFSKDIWDELEELFNKNKIISHVLVYDELTTSSKIKDDLTKWIEVKRNYFKGFTDTQAYYVSKIISQFPNLIDPDREKDEADPWLIALALEEQFQVKLFNPNQEVVVVSEESMKSPQKIPAVCKKFGIKHLSVLEFFSFHGWDFVIKKRIT